MWHPWRNLRDQHPDYDVYVTALPDGYAGMTRVEDRRIWIEKRLLQAGRRWALTHETIHVERGDVGPCNPKLEAAINIEAARRLIDLEDLANAAVWAQTLHELAAELWVPRHAVVTRFDHLSPTERGYVNHRVAQRDQNCRCGQAGCDAC